MDLAQLYGERNPILMHHASANTTECVLNNVNTYRLQLTDTDSILKQLFLYIQMKVLNIKHCIKPKFEFYKKTNHPISSNSHPLATANKAIHSLKIGGGGGYGERINI